MRRAFWNFAFAISFGLVCGSGPTPEGWELPTISRSFNPANQENVLFFKAANRDEADCPSHNFKMEEIRSRSDNDKIFVVPHTKIVADNVRCGKSGTKEEYMLLVPSVLLLDELSARVGGVTDLYNLIQGNERFLRGWKQLVSVDALYVGVEMTDRYCGDKLFYAKDSLFLMIFAENRTINFGADFGYLSGTEAGIMAYQTPVGDNLSRLCVYKDSIIPFPNVSPVASPPPFPAAASIPSSSPNAFAGIPGFPDTPPPSPSSSLAPEASSDPSSVTPTSTTPSESPASPSTSPGIPVQTPDKSASDASPSASPSPSPAEDKAACFPAAATVEKEDGSFVRMDGLKIGDRVRVGESSFSSVFMFTHKMSGAALHEFVHVRAESGHSLYLSPGHYLFIADELKTASAVTIGDELTLSNGEKSAVVAVERTHKRGLYNPQTVDGQIVVDGIAVSTYTKSVHPSVAHAILTPFRFLHRVGVLPSWGALERSSYGLSHLAPRGPPVF